jgi:tRNA G18 (ribose-2'-O)-methylase SpoU
MEPDLSLENDRMETPRFQVRQCTNAACRLRFSTVLGDPRAERCPICRSATQVVETRLDSSDSPVAAYERFAVKRGIEHPVGPQLEVLLDNIRSAWNVGSMLRSCDGAGVRHVHLCGVSSTPDNPKVAKTALGAEKSLPWTFSPDGVSAVRLLKDQGLRVWALEGGPRAESLFDVMANGPEAAVLKDPVVLVAGNELSGVDPGILNLCDRVVCLPMQGIKGSLNVAVAFGIAVYTIRFGASRRPA